MAINRLNKRSVCRGTNVIFLTARGWNRNRSPRHFLGGFATCHIFPRKAQNVALKPRFPAFFVRLFHTARKLIWFSPNTHERGNQKEMHYCLFPLPALKEEAQTTPVWEGKETHCSIPKAENTSQTKRSRPILGMPVLLGLERQGIAAWHKALQVRYPHWLTMVTRSCKRSLSLYACACSSRPFLEMYGKGACLYLYRPKYCVLKARKLFKKRQELIHWLWQKDPPWVLCTGKTPGEEPQCRQKGAEQPLPCQGTCCTQRC